MAIEPYLRPELMFVFRNVASRDELFQRLSEAVDNLLPAVSAAELQDLLRQREEKRPTSTPEGVAFPHALLSEINETLVAVAVIPGGVDFGVPDHPKAGLVFCLFGSTDHPWQHVKTLARMSRIVHTERARAALRAAKTPAELHEIIVSEDQSHG